MVTRRVRTSLVALEEFARRCGDLPLPWTTPPDGASQRAGRTADHQDGPDLLAALGHLPGAASPGEGQADPAEELRHAGLLDGDAPAEEPTQALRLLAGAPARVDIDVAVRDDRASGAGARLRSWHRLHAGAFAAVSTTDARTVEVAWGGRHAWSDELVRVATVAPPGAIATSPPRHQDVDWQVLADPGRATGSAVVLHDSCRGRLRALVHGVRNDGDRVLGAVEWLLYPDGWRSLTPYADGGPRVRLDAVAPDGLARQLAPILVVLAQ